MRLDPDRCYQALLSRDRRFDGRFFTAVVTTGVYCRPICPANKPRRENCRFFACAAAAEKAGFRPCLRCRPEAAPNTPAWAGTSATVARAIRLISEGALDEGGVEALSRRLGVGARHLRRLFRVHLGTTPTALAQTRRIHFARQLLRETELSVTEVAFASGFSSVRRFNSALREAFAKSPSDLRRLEGRDDGAPPRGSSHRFTVRLPYRPPFDWEALLEFLAARAIPGVEAVSDSCYRRTIEVDGTLSHLSVEDDREGCHLVLTLERSASANLLGIVERIRNLFDLDADPGRIAEDLGRDPVLVPLIEAHPGLRVPGAWDGFEIAVRAILGQQVSVAGATTLSGRLVQRFGAPIDGGLAGRPDGLTHRFPTPERLAGIPAGEIAAIGMPRSRGEAIRGLARGVTEQRIFLDRSGGLEGTVSRLKQLPGIGDWTAQYIAMRALGEPDAFPSSDLVLRKELARWTVGAASNALDPTRAWSPWRSYVALLMWRNHARSTSPRTDPRLCC